MLASRKRPSPLLLAVTLVLILLFYQINHADRIYQQWSFSFELRPTKLPANSTLGFGAIVAVSRDDSKRRHSLVQAANVTDLDLTIPRQPNWTEGDLQRFVNGQTDIQRGSMLAWLGHHNALRWFLDSGLETALILEDDVDWDIRLRSVQIPLAASAIRQLVPPQRSFHPLTNFGNHHTQYWGNHDSWDLLYLGHCGDYFEPVTDDGLHLDQHHNLTVMPHIQYNDSTVPSPPDLHPFTQILFNDLQVPAHSRIIHRSKFPLCSFGYAVTRSAAERLLDDLAPAKLTESGPRAFDVALLNSCRKGAKTPSPTPADGNPSPHPNPELRDRYPSPGLRCWTVNSELFHHMPGHSLVDEIGTKSGEGPGIPPVDLAAQAQVIQRNETTNIDCGFWSGAFAFDSNNTDQLRYLREHVGRRGECLKERNQQIPPPLTRMEEYELEEYDPEEYEPKEYEPEEYEPEEYEPEEYEPEEGSDDTPQKPLD
ncbi:hypothetical protein CC86DRAFT_331157 [Ophiobolus disseminans]|uniref:Glycosyltransferase family 25 protein n=1 Tax=Ophiobolus disseminans TaxID=1469910 RepID=A0A6A6ZPB6_9PLEO|nr:hypothetical protein CC86DRAFT_331157 [Ophiobolus disseminans]